MVWPPIPACHFDCGTLRRGVVRTVPPNGRCSSAMELRLPPRCRFASLPHKLLPAPIFRSVRSLHRAVHLAASAAGFPCFDGLLYSRCRRAALRWNGARNSFSGFDPRRLPAAGRDFHPRLGTGRRCNCMGLRAAWVFSFTFLDMVLFSLTFCMRYHLHCFFIELWYTVPKGGNANEPYLQV